MPSLYDSSELMKDVEGGRLSDNTIIAARLPTPEVPVVWNAQLI
jgi:hypothetical protein